MVLYNVRKGKGMNTKLREEIRRDLRKYGSEILHSDKFKSSKNNIQHSDVSVMKHSMKVAYTSVWLKKKLHVKCHDKDLVRGALLHDYFLYDWHDPEHKPIKNLHGFYHPGVALKNATKDYSLTDREKNIIYTHMWPLTLTHMPKYREAWIVTLADKYVSTVESLRLHKIPGLVRVKAKD